MVVLDEMPYLAREDPGFEGTLQKSFDRTLSRLPVLLVLIGSDLAMMEALNTYGRPFYQRGTEMVVPPLNPAEVATMLGVRPADAIDAYLVTGGLPLILDEWPAGGNPVGIPGIRREPADLGPDRQRRAGPRGRVPHRGTGPHRAGRDRAR